MAVWFCVTVTLLCVELYTGTVQSQANTYALDRQGTCNQQITVYDQELTLTARSNVAPANPPLECVVYLESAYELSDGRYRLQMVVEQLLIEDCNVRLAIFNGKGASGNYLRELGCSSKSTDIIYTNDRQATVRFSRPQDLYKTAYAITITVKTYADGNQMQTAVGVDKMATGGIIAIVVGILAIIALVILLIWCCCTGYIRKFVGGDSGSWGASRAWRGNSAVDYTTSANLDNAEKLSTTSSDYQLRNGINYNDPAIWSSLTGLNKVGGGGNRNFQAGVPRRQASMGGPRGDNYENEARQRNNENNRPRDSQVYETYDQEDDKSPRFRKRKDTTRRSRRSQGEEDGEGVAPAASKETLIDEPLSTDNDSIQKPPLDSDESDDVAAAKLRRFESEPDVDTIASPTHVNAGVRASIPDLTREDSPTPSPRAKKRSSVSPKSRKKKAGGKGGHEPDPMGLPPEAFDPIFTTPTSQEQYPGEFRPQQQPMMPFMPYGMFPMVPGQQMYAYAYQAAPQMGAPPGNQSAFFVQSVPTADGSVQNTAFAMHSSRAPKGRDSKGKGGIGMGHPGAPDFTSTPDHRGRGSPTPDLSLIARGAAPPDPGQGHRAMEMKSYADPDTGMQTTQVLWTDNVPDPTDPQPGDSSQVTRKTITRVTTRSGQGDLPTKTTTLLDDQDPNPAFLSPSAPQRAALMNHPAAVTPNTSNVDYYLGPGPTAQPARPPDVFREGQSRSKAIRDRVRLADSEA